jgi:hypothetical protein
MTNTKPPPWNASEAVMTKWVIENLRFDPYHPGVMQDIEDLENMEEGGLAYVIRRAEQHKDIAPLREKLCELLPKLAKTPVQAKDLKYIAEHFFVDLPKRRVGRKYPLEDDAVGNAIYDSKLITALWQQHYGKSRRRRGLVTADEIAAKRRGVTVTKMNIRRGNDARTPKPRT